jgi:D-sedoheptulose 7-phosphate isomerase
MKTLVEGKPRSSSIELVETRFQNIVDIFQNAAASAYPGEVAHVAEVIGDAFASGHKLLLFGNGGSASDAQHLCGELVVRFQTERRPLPAMALCCDTAVLTACANDYAFTDVFARQIEALGNPGDIAIGISTSGKSPNVVRAFQAAQRHGLMTILFTGPAGGEACQYSNVVLAAPGPNTAHVQELHLASYHAICELIDCRFTSQPNARSNEPDLNSPALSAT